MARDDYFVIVYQILSYLYCRLKAGESIDAKMINYDSPLFEINKKYWAYIMYHIASDDLIEGVSFVNIDGLTHPYPADISNCSITPKGIAYLCDNSFISKAKQFLKDIKEITPFI